MVSCGWETKGTLVLRRAHSAVSLPQACSLHHPSEATSKLYMKLAEWIIGILFHFLPDFSLSRSSQAVLIFSKNEVNVEIRIFSKISLLKKKKKQRKRHWTDTSHFGFILCIFSPTKRREWKTFSQRNRWQDNKNIICYNARITRAVIWELKETRDRKLETALNLTQLRWHTFNDLRRKLIFKPLSCSLPGNISLCLT